MGSRAHLHTCQFPQEWLLHMLASAERFTLDDGKTTAVADYWGGGVCFYILRDNDHGEITRLSHKGEWLIAYAANDAVAFNNETAFTNLSDALLTYQRSRCVSS